MKKIHAPHGGIAMICMLACTMGCTKKADLATDIPEPVYKVEMRTLIQDISAFAKQQQPSFLIVPQDGLILLTRNDVPSGEPDNRYMSAIDGIAQEEVNFGYDKLDDVATPSGVRSEYLSFLRLAKEHGKRVLVTDYCFTASKMTSSYSTNAANGFISYAANHRLLDNIATTSPYNVNNKNIASLDSAKNFLYLINTSKYTSKTAFISAVKATNFDVLIIDAFFKDSTAFSSADITSLKTKANGGRRLVLSYMAIGQAENFRWYWNPDWKTNPPAWLVPGEDPKWPGNYNIKYWTPEWKSIIYGYSGSYTQRLIDAGFDGTYLDLYNFRYWAN